MEKKKMISAVKQGAVALVMFSFVLMMLPVASNAACAHSSLGPQYSEATHPHKYYRTCNSCGVKVYTGGQETKKHGPGTWGSGTCKLCGSHSFKETSAQTAHPHKHISTCVCGDTRTVYMLTLSCSQCKASSKTVSNSTSHEVMLSYMDGDAGSGTQIRVPVIFKVYYSNKYNQPNLLPGGYYTLKFASWTSMVTCSVIERPTNIPMSQISAVASLDVSYCNSSNVRVYNQKMIWNSNSSSSLSNPGDIVMLSSMPSYAIAKGICSIGSSQAPGEVKTYF